MNISREKGTILKGHVIFQPSIFRGYVSAQGGIPPMGFSMGFSHLRFFRMTGGTLVPLQFGDLAPISYHQLEGVQSW